MWQSTQVSTSIIELLHLFCINHQVQKKCVTYNSHQALRFRSPRTQLTAWCGEHFSHISPIVDKIDGFFGSLKSGHLIQIRSLGFAECICGWEVMVGTSTCRCLVPDRIKSRPTRLESWKIILVRLDSGATYRSACWLASALMDTRVWGLCLTSVLQESYCYKYKRPFVDFTVFPASPKNLQPFTNPLTMYLSTLLLLTLSTLTLSFTIPNNLPEGV